MSIISPMNTHIVMALQAESKGELQNTMQNLGFSVHYTGVGMLASAQKTTEIILKHQPQNILNLGTAGSFLIEPGQLVEVEQVIYRGESFHGLNKKIQLKEFLTDKISPSVSEKKLAEDKLTVGKLTQMKLDRVICGSADFVELQTVASSQTEGSTQKFDIMDMEAYAIATVCEKYKVPFYCVKYISDRSGADVVQEWKSHLQRASQQFNELLVQLVLAQGVKK